MRALLVYPEYPLTYWGFQHALKFINKKAAYPPLGLLTVAALLPDCWEKRLVDMNTDRLRDKDILWADYVFISAMAIQRHSASNVIDRCRKLGIKTVGGGPLFTSDPEDFSHVDHLLLNEGEITVPAFLRDLEEGREQHLYTTDQYAELEHSPVPRWDLIKTKKYASMNIQYSRGCPFSCDFCNITALFGSRPRTKSSGQILRELEAIHASGWRGSVFFVDDNFICNKKQLLEEILPSIKNWMQKRGYPFNFLTEASINLSDDERLMTMMVEAGFRSVFIGIETPDENSLAECKKSQNRNRDLISCIKKIQRYGLEVQGGFIVGFDSDCPSIFNRMVDFIQESGIISAMVGLLNAPKGTKLYQRLSGEGRITEEFSGDNTGLAMNFSPKMNKEILIRGYRKIVTTIYSPKHYYNRVLSYLKNSGGLRPKCIVINPVYILAFFKSIIRLGLIGKERFHFWKLFLWSLFRRPMLLPAAIKYSIFGYHFRKIYESFCNNAGPEFDGDI